MIKRINILLIALLSVILIGCSKNTTSVNTTTSFTTQTTTVEQETTTMKNKNLLDKWQESDCYSYSINSLGKTVMPIGGWCAPTNGYNDLEQFKIAKESGINILYGLYENTSLNPTEVKRALGYADEAGLKYFVRDPSLYAYSEDAEDFKSHVNEYSKYESFAGMLVMDEPGANQFQTLATTQKLFRQYYSDYCHFVNLFPIYASCAQFENRGTQEAQTDMTFDEYLTKYIETVKPKFVSYDYYPCSGKYPALSSSYFEQLYVVSEICNKYKIPFWSFIQTCDFGGRSRVPNEAEIKWQVNTALAYGAKGIQYFCYFIPTEFESAGYSGCLIDGSGNKTSLFEPVKRINAQISSMDEILMKSTLVNKMVFGDSPAPFVEENLPTSFREIKSIVTEGDLFVGCFDYNGKSVFYFVNNNTQESLDAIITFTSEIEANAYGIDGISQVKGEETLINLAPGDAIMYELTNYR